MGFSISDLNPISFLSDVAQSICHQVLPHDLQFVGDLVGIGADFETGNWMKGVEHFSNLVRDLPQSLASWAVSARSASDPSHLLPPSFLEPTPPPIRGSGTTTWQRPVRGSGPPTTNLETSSASPIWNPTASAADTPLQGTAATTTAAANTTAATTSADDPFLHQSAASILSAVASGNIPDSVRNDPALMQQLLARVNQITEMNHLISQMLAAIHAMNDQVIQNIRA
jgi:hypothetical protein